MSATLRITLQAGEKIYINGAVHPRRPQGRASSSSTT